VQALAPAAEYLPEAQLEHTDESVELKSLE